MTFELVADLTTLTEFDTAEKRRMNQAYYLSHYTINSKEKIRRKSAHCHDY